MSYNKEIEMYEGYIYKITNSINNKLYIGQTITTIQERWSNHKSDARTNHNHTVLYRAMNKYGIENFNIIEICKVFNVDKTELKNILNSLEIYYIKLYNSTNRDFGYNITSGGNNVDHMMKKVKQYDLYGNLIKIWDSMSEAADYYGTDRGLISSCCSGKIKTCVGFIWRYIDDKFNKYGDDYLPTRKINKFDTNGNLLKTYLSAKEASIDNNCSIIAIFRACEGKSLFACGFIWRYYGDAFDKYDVPKKGTILNHKKSVEKYDLNMNLLDVYDSVKEASIINGCDQSGIIRSCKGERKTCKNFIWRYADDDFYKYII